MTTRKRAPKTDSASANPAAAADNIHRLGGAAGFLTSAVEASLPVIIDAPLDLAVAYEVWTSLESAQSLLARDIFTREPFEMVAESGLLPFLKAIEGAIIKSGGASASISGLEVGIEPTERHPFFGIEISLDHCSEGGPSHWSVKGASKQKYLRETVEGACKRVIAEFFPERVRWYFLPMVDCVGSVPSIMPELRKFVASYKKPSKNDSANAPGDTVTARLPAGAHQSPVPAAKTLRRVAQKVTRKVTRSKPKRK